MNDRQAKETIKKLREQRDAANAEVELLKSRLSAARQDGIMSTLADRTTLAEAVKAGQRRIAQLESDLGAEAETNVNLRLQLERRQSMHDATENKLNEYIEKVRSNEEVLSVVRSTVDELGEILGVGKNHHRGEILDAAKKLVAELSSLKAEDTKRLRRRLEEKTKRISGLERMEKDYHRVLAYVGLSQKHQLEFIDLLERHEKALTDAFVKDNAERKAQQTESVAQLEKEAAEKMARPNPNLAEAKTYEKYDPEDPENPNPHLLIDPEVKTDAQYEDTGACKCDECGEYMPEDLVFAISDKHGSGCSLNPANVVPAPKTDAQICEECKVEGCAVHSHGVGHTTQADAIAKKHLQQEETHPKRC